MLPTHAYRQAGGVALKKPHLLAVVGKSRAEIALVPFDGDDAEGP